MHTHLGHAKGFMGFRSFHLISHPIPSSKVPSCGPGVLLCDVAAVTWETSYLCVSYKWILLGICFECPPLKESLPQVGLLSSFHVPGVCFSSSQEPGSFMCFPREQHDRKEG